MWRARIDAVTTTESPRNEWRQQTPGPEDWLHTARPDDPDKYFMVSADCHANEPADYLADRVEPEYRDRLPHIEVRDDGSQFSVTEGNRPMMIKPPDAFLAQAKGERAHFTQRLEPEDALRNATGRTIEQRLVDQTADGVDIELIFPNKGLVCWATPDPVFADAMCHAWNRWAYEFHGGEGGWSGGRTRPLACIATGDLDCALAEVTWAAEHDFVGLCLGNSPVYGPKIWGHIEYNDPAFEPLWSLVEEIGLPITFHVSTGRDPRAVGGNGGAIINYVCHSMETTIEPLVQLITSGVFERHPRMHAGLVESGHRLRAVAPRDDGLRIQGAPLLGAARYPGAPLRVLPPSLLRHVPGRPRRRPGRGAPRPRRQPHVGERLPAPRGRRGRTRPRRSSGRWVVSSDESRAKILGGNAVRVFSL